MKVYSIDPHNGEYFEDKESLGPPLYQGAYNYTPIYPLYTFSVPNRFNYNSESEIEFNTMLPIKRLFNKYLVEFRFRFFINPLEKNSLNIAIEEFNRLCEEHKKNIKIKGFIKK